MLIDFSSGEISALNEFLAESAADIILKTDCEGFILHASPAMERWGLPLPNTLTGSHILHLVHPFCAVEVREEHDAVIRGGRDGQWVEFLALTNDGQAQWFHIQMRRLVDDDDRPYGALSIMRSINERRTLEDRLFAATVTDPLTGLSNRKAFISMLQHLVNQRNGGCLAIFAIDNFKAINMRHGHAAADEALIAFSDLLRTLMGTEDIISRVGDENLGVLFPSATLEQAAEVCRCIVSALSDMSGKTGACSSSITASIGLSRIGRSLDGTMKQAELALFLAKAKGGCKLEIYQGSRLARMDAVTTRSA